MRKIIYVLSSLLLLLLAMGCGGSEETAVPLQPTDPIAAEEETQTVTARPQLIEFYANW